MTTLSRSENDQHKTTEILTTEFDNHLNTQLTSLSSAFYLQMRQANHYLNIVSTISRTDKSYDEQVVNLNRHMQTKVYPLLAQIKNLQQNYENNSTESQRSFMQSKLLWESTNTNANISQRIAEETQRFDSIKHLSKQSHELYLRQNNVMWIYIALFILLCLGFCFMYYWMHTTSPAYEHSLSNLPHNKKSIIDNNAFQHEDLFGEDEDAEDHDEDDEDDEDDEGAEDYEDKKHEHKQETPIITAQNSQTPTQKMDDVSSLSNISSSSSQNRDSSLFR